jgi:hypothetical protein
MRRRTVVLLSLSGVLGALLVAGVLVRTLGMDARVEDCDLIRRSCTSLR